MQPSLCRRDVLKMLPAPIAGLISPILTCEASQDDGETDIPTARFHDVAAHVEMLYKLPDWPSDRDLTKDEWHQYLFEAVSLNRSHHVAVYALLTTVTIIESMSLLRTLPDDHKLRRFSEVGRTGIHRRIVVLLRTMFDIPIEQRMANVNDRLMLHAAGGHGVNLWNDWMTGTELTLPVIAPNGTPRLCGSFKREVGGTNYTYEPQLEYAYFHRRFRARADLDKLLPEGFGPPPELR